MDKESKYEKMYRAMMEYEDRTHLRNKHRIRVGIACLVFVPIFFLVLMFMTDSSKPLFLMLWIISLYGIAVFLILVEYADHKLQKRLAQFRGEEEVEVRALIGQHMENMEETLRNVKDKAEHFLMISTGEEPAEIKEADEAQEIEEVLDLNLIVPDVVEAEEEPKEAAEETQPEELQEAAEAQPEDQPEKVEEVEAQQEEAAEAQPEEPQEEAAEDQPEAAEEITEQTVEASTEETAEQSVGTGEEKTNEKHS